MEEELKGRKVEWEVELRGSKFEVRGRLNGRKVEWEEV